MAESIDDAQAAMRTDGSTGQVLRILSHPLDGSTLAEWQSRPPTGSVASGRSREARPSSCHWAGAPCGTSCRSLRGFSPDEPPA
jgi:hypothetical protein